MTNILFGIYLILNDYIFKGVSLRFISLFAFIHVQAQISPITD